MVINKHTDNFQLQILQLLDSMKLQKYRSVFEAKAVDGFSLAQFTEDNLLTDLNMTSRLDRIRLMKLIKTRWVKLIPGEDGGNYVMFEKAN